MLAPDLFTGVDAGVRGAVANIGKLYTEVPTRTGATWQNKVPRMFPDVQKTIGIEQKCLWVVGVYGISPAEKDNAWKSVVVLETHTVEDANFSYGI